MSKRFQADRKLLDLGFHFDILRALWKPMIKAACIKGQWGVPLTVYPWYLLCSLGILGDNLPINTHYIGLI